LDYNLYPRASAEKFPGGEEAKEKKRPKNSKKSPKNSTIELLPVGVEGGSNGRKTEK